MTPFALSAFPALFGGRQVEVPSSQLDLRSGTSTILIRLETVQAAQCDRDLRNVEPPVTQVSGRTGLSVMPDRFFGDSGAARGVEMLGADEDSDSLSCLCGSER